MSTRKIIGWLSLCLVGVVSAQTDSLIQIAHQLPDGQERADLYRDLAFELYYSDAETALLLCDSLETLGQRLADDSYRAKAHYLRAVTLHQRGNYTKALEEVKAALAIFTLLDDPISINTVRSMEGTIYTKLGLLDEATTSLLEAARQSERAGDTLGIALAYHNLGNALFDHEDKTQAARYYREAIDHYETIDAGGFLGMAHVALGNCLSVPDSIYYHFQAGEQLIREQELEYELLTVYHSYAFYYDLIEQYEQALHYERQTLELARAFEDAQFQVSAHIGLGQTFAKLGQTNSAISHLKTGIELAENYHMLNEIDNSYAELAELYRQTGQLALAADFFERGYAYRDSLHASYITEQVQANTARYELERKERKIAEQQLQIAEEENARNRLLLIGLLLLGTVVGLYQWFLLRQRKRKQSTELALVQQQAEAQRLREVDELKTNFFTNISHELRTPLTLILSPVTDLLASVQSTPRREKLSIIQRNAQRLLNLVNEIMDLAKVEAGKLELKASTVALQPFLRRVFSSFESLAKLRRVDYQLEELPEALHIRIDREKLEHILHNLLSNALKYTPAGGQVQMRVQRMEDKLEIVVKDTGYGIASEDLLHIFDRFYQAKHGQEPLQGGTGVGLALVRELSQLLGGTIKVESTLGEGSIFILSLPLELAEASVQEATPTTLASDTESPPIAYAPLSVQGDKPRVLIVEDHPEMGRYLIQLLSTSYHCVWATDGREALRLLRQQRFDCITSDVMMPNMDGFELRAAINKEAEWRQIPFLLLTARHLETDKIRGFQLGIDDYLTKPFSSRELEARVHNLIANKLERDSCQQSQVPTEEAKPINVDQQLLRQLEASILDHIDNPQYGVEDLARSVNYSSKQVGRILKRLTGLTSVAFILEVRLQRARELLEKRLVGSVLEAQLAVGISSTSYFTKKFTARFGSNPREVLEG